MHVKELQSPCTLPGAEHMIAKLFTPFCYVVDAEMVVGDKETKNRKNNNTINHGFVLEINKGKLMGVILWPS